MHLDIARATSADAPEVVALMHANSPEQGGMLNGELTASQLRDWIAGAMPVMVARRNSHVVGVLFTSNKHEGGPSPVRAMLAVWPGADNAYLYGPVCIADSERGKGVLPQLYEAVRQQLPGRDAILFIRRDNLASLKAHRRLGMRDVAGFNVQGMDFAVFTDAPPAS